MDFVTFDWTTGHLEKFTTARPPAPPARPPAPPARPPLLCVLAFVAGDWAATLAETVIAYVPTNVKLVVAFNEETRLSNLWVSSMWPDKQVRLVSWQEDGEPYYILLLTSRHVPPEAEGSRNSGTRKHSTLESRVYSYVSRVQPALAPTRRSCSSARASTCRPPARTSCSTCRR